MAPSAGGGLPYLPFHRSACVGAGLAGRSLGRSLPANFRACSAQLGLRPGGGGRSPSVLTGKLLQTKKQKFLEAFVRYAAINTKKTKRCGMLRLLRSTLEKRGQNFGAGKILPKNPIFQGAELFILPQITNKQHQKFRRCQAKLEMSYYYQIRNVVFFCF
jgi:hypothetical protein